MDGLSRNGPSGLRPHLAVQRTGPGLRAPHGPFLRWADGMEPRCNSYERSRAKRRLAVGLPNLLDRLGSRARRLSFYTHPGTRDRIAVQPGVVRTAASASPEHALGIVGSDLSMPI